MEEAIINRVANSGLISIDLEYYVNKADRIVPIHKKVKKILRELYKLNRKTGLVFYRTVGVKLNNNFVSKQFKQAVRESNLNERIHFHTLRHSFASNLLQNGASIYAIKELLGHEDIKTTQVYSHLTQSSLMSTVSLL